MFGTIRRHQTWLWAVIITLTIISFVIFFSPYSKMNGPGGGAFNYGSINGERVTREMFDNARNEIVLRYLFGTGTWLDDQEAKRAQIDLEEQIYQWLLIVQAQERSGIHVGSEEVAQAARELLRPFQKQGVTSPSMFVEQVLRPRGFDVDDYERYARHFIGLQELIATVTVSGKLITPQEAQSLYKRENEELATEAVFFLATNYLSKVTVTPEGLSRYYSNHLADYRIPERVQVGYVKFETTNFLTQADKAMEKMTNLNEQVESVYRQRGTNYYSDAKTPEEAKQRIRDDLRKELALREARTQAGAFANELFDMNPMRAENLETLGSQKGLKVNVSAPFTRRDGPTDIQGGLNFAPAAFKLTPTNNPFSEPIVGDDGVYVLAYNRQIPSEIPPMDQVRERVEAEYKHSEAVNQARAAGMAFYPSATNITAQGQSFSAICSNANFNAVQLTPFSLSTRELAQLEGQVEFNTLKQTAFTTLPGQVSRFQPTTEGGFILYVKARLPVDPSKMQADLPAFTTALRQSRQNEAFQAWFHKEVDKGLRDTPYFQSRQQQPPSMSPRARRT